MTHLTDPPRQTCCRSGGFHREETLGGLEGRRRDELRRAVLAAQLLGRGDVEGDVNPRGNQPLAAAAEAVRPIDQEMRKRLGVRRRVAAEERAEEAEAEAKRESLDWREW